MSVKIVGSHLLPYHRRGVNYCPHCKSRFAKQGKKFCTPCRKEINKQIGMSWYQFTRHWEKPKQ